MIEYAKYYYTVCSWEKVAILHFEGEFAVVRNERGRYLRVPLDKLEHY